VKETFRPLLNTWKRLDNITLKVSVIKVQMLLGIDRLEVRGKMKKQQIKMKS